MTENKVRRRFLKYAIVMLGCTLLVFWLLSYYHIVDWYFELEARLIAWILNGLGVPAISRGAAVVLPPVVGAITLSCSSIGMAIMLFFLLVLTPNIPLKRNLFGILIALSLVYVGNLLRMAGAFIIGRQFGPDAMLSYHDWVGPIISVLYVIVAYCIWNYIIISSRRRSFIY